MFKRLAYDAKLGDGSQCSPFSLGSIARKKIQDSQNGMNPGQDDVVIRALETSCTQPQLDVWASQMGRAWVLWGDPTESSQSYLALNCSEGLQMALANDFAG